MCSLAGCLHGERRRFIENATTEMAGRGPLVGRYDNADGMTMLSHRLDIIGGDAYNMPYRFEHLIASYNGEIYNHKELAAIFALSDQAFESDTHCLVEGYAIYGKDFFNYLEGMFAFAIYDEKGQVLTLGRDQFGTKPLYCGKQDEGFYFASEMKAFKDTELDEAIVVAPGELIEFSPAGIEFSTIEYRSPYPKREFADLFVDSIKKHIPAEKFALLLSGGIDSTLLALYLNSYGANFVAYSAASRDYSVDADDAHVLATRLGIEHHVIEFNPEDIDAKQLTYRMETGNERILYGAAILDQVASQIAKDGLRIVMDGNGADEVFMGYREFAAINTPDLRYGVEEYRTTIFPNAQAQRADRIAGTYQLEGRHPYLFQPFLNWLREQATAEVMGKQPLLELLGKSALGNIGTRLLSDGKKYQLISGTTGKSSFETYFSDEQRQLIKDTFTTSGFDRFVSIDGGEGDFFRKYSIGGK